MNSLSIDLRPTEIGQVIGHDAIKLALQKQIDSGTIPRAFMFSGPPGVGKTTLATILSRMVQGSDFPADGEIDCITHNAADLNGVDAIREMVADSVYRPFSGRFRVRILDEAQQLTGPAQNVLLKPFEEVDSPTIWVLTTTDPSKIIQPLQDRCKHFKLRGMAEVQVIELIERAAKHLGVSYSDPFVVTAVNANITSPRVLLQAFEKFASGIPLKDCFASAAHEPFYKDIALSVVKGDWNTCRGLLAEVQTADSKALRNIVSSFLRSALIKCEAGPKADAIATCLVGMGTAGFEDGLSWSSTVGLFYKCAKAISGTKTKEFIQ